MKLTKKKQLIGAIILLPLLVVGAILMAQHPSHKVALAESAANNDASNVAPADSSAAANEVTSTPTPTPTTASQPAVQTSPTVIAAPATQTPEATPAPTPAPYVTMYYESTVIDCSNNSSTVYRATWSDTHSSTETTKPSTGRDMGDDNSVTTCSTSPR